MESNGQDPTPALDFGLYADGEQQLLSREVDADSLIQWHGIKSEIEAEIHGFDVVRRAIEMNTRLSEEGKRLELAQASEQYGHRLGLIESQIVTPINQGISALEDVLTAPASSPVDAVLRYLKSNEIRSQLSRLNAVELQAAYEQAVDDEDTDVLEAFHTWPGKRLRPIAKEQTDAGKRRIVERQHPEETAKLARLKRLQQSYQSLLQQARHQLGLTSTDDPVQHTAVAGQL